MDKAAFFAAVRQGILGPTLDPSEVSGCEAIMDAMAGLPRSWCAYALGTAYLETAHSMQPVLEANWLSPASRERYFTRMYDITGQRPKKARELGNTTPGDGAKYPGRGYPQMTGKANYAKATAKLRAMGHDVDLVANPELAMRPDIAALIMRFGMVEGWFTGKGFADYLPYSGGATLKVYMPARRIINGMDRAADVASAAMSFEAALAKGGWA